MRRHSPQKTDRYGGRPAVMTLLLCLSAALCEGFDVQAAGVAAAGMSHELRPSAQALGLFFSSGGAGLLLGALAGGRASDRFGRKRVLTVSIAAFGLLSLVTSVAPEMHALIGARFLTGLGLGGAMPNLIALAADASAISRRNGNVAIAYVGMPLGGAIASLFVAALPLEAWRLVFRVGGIAPLVLLPLMIRYIPTASPRAPVFSRASARMDAVRGLLGNERAFTTVALWAGFFLIVLTLHLMLNWLPLLLMGRGLPKAVAIGAQAGFNLGGVLTGACVGKLLDSRWRLSAILTTVAALPLLLIAVSMCPPAPGLLVGLAFLLGGSIISEQVILYGVASACYETAWRGTGTGAAVAVGRAGSLIGPLIAAWLLAAGRSPAQVLLDLLPIAAVCSASVGLLGRRELCRAAETDAVEPSRPV